ncbi:sigma-70 family RNA polymerase sigma factor [Candidatus Peregrinibacteria bacterium]|nr:MAG: sigma-70 family RNA polymerase sigma factor [Candidatus Peregrinibacteria bacterium]
MPNNEKTTDNPQERIKVELGIDLSRFSPDVLRGRVAARTRKALLEALCNQLGAIPSHNAEDLPDKPDADGDSPLPLAVTAEHLKSRFDLLVTAQNYLPKKEGLTIDGNPLRPLQIDALEGVYEWLCYCIDQPDLMGHLVQPFGSGKTGAAILISEMLGGRSVIIAHHNADRLRRSFESHESKKTGKQRTVGQCYGGKTGIDSEVTVTTFQSSDHWADTMNWDEVNVIIIDEADVNALSSSRRNLIKRIAKKHNIPVIGMSATEVQSSGKELEDVFPQRVHRLAVPDGLRECNQLGLHPDMTFTDLYLSAELAVPVQHRSPKIVSEQGGEPVEDYGNDTVNELIRSNAWATLILQDYLDRGHDNHSLKPALISLRDNTLVGEFIAQATKLGIRAEALTGDPSVDRANVEQRYLKGEIDLLVGSKLMERSLHLPNVRLVYNSTITKSPQLFWQANGRGASIDPSAPQEPVEVICVVPEKIVNQKTGEPLSKPELPLCNAAFFDPDYYDGKDDLIIGAAGRIYERGKAPQRRTHYHFDLKNYYPIRSVREVARIREEMTRQATGAESRAHLFAKYIRASALPINSGAVFHSISKLNRTELKARIEALGELNVDFETGPKMHTDGQASTLNSILRQCQTSPSLSPSYEKYLVKRARNTKHDPRRVDDFKNACSVLIHAYLPLVVAIAEKFSSNVNELSDYIQVGTEAVLMCINSMSGSSAKLSTRMVVYITNGIQRYHDNTKSLIRVPLHTQEKLAAAFMDVSTNLGVAEPEGGIQHRRYPALDSFVYGEDGKPTILADALEVHEAEFDPQLVDDLESAVLQPDKILEYYELRKAIRKILSTLAIREEKVIKMLHGIDQPGGTDLSRTEIGEALDVLGQRIAQIENSALRKLRHPKRRGRLDEHVDAAIERHFVELDKKMLHALQLALEECIRSAMLSNIDPYVIINDRNYNLTKESGDSASHASTRYILTPSKPPNQPIVFRCGGEGEYPLVGLANFKMNQAPVVLASAANFLKNWAQIKKTLDFSKVFFSD